MPGRRLTNNGYRYGFQGQEKDDEIKGEGNSVNYKYRMHDPRIGRFFAVDPIGWKFAWNSPYVFSENRVIDGLELEGLEVFSVHGDARVAAVATLSLAVGFMFDKEGVVIFATGGAGGGITLGAGVGGGVSYSSVDLIEDALGPGMSVGAFGDVVVGAEVTLDVSNNLPGFTVGGGVGAGFGIFAEGTYTIATGKVSYESLAAAYLLTVPASVVNELGLTKQGLAAVIFNEFKNKTIVAINENLVTLNSDLDMIQNGIEFNTKQAQFHLAQGNGLAASMYTTEKAKLEGNLEDVKNDIKYYEEELEVITNMEYESPSPEE